MQEEINSILAIVVGALNSAIISLVDYLSFHVLLCLVPAFFIAGAMIVFIPSEAITKHLGKESPKYVSYPMAAAAGFLLAVCSCTVLPLFAGIWKKGAGLGPAVTFLFTAPAVNLLALTYTGTLIGLDIALARAILSILIAIIIGLIMATLFQDGMEEKSEQEMVEVLRDEMETFILLKSEIIAIIVMVISGLLLAFFDHEMLLKIGINDPPLIQTIVFLIGLVAIVVLSFLSKNEKLTLFTWLIYTLFTGTSQIKYFDNSIDLFGVMLTKELLNMITKGILTGIVVVGLILYTWQKIEPEDTREWISETWDFFKQILPLIIIGVFIAGFIKFFIPQEIVKNLVGRNTVLANLIGVLFGVFMYFPTLMEVPIARMFLDMGMSRGVLLAYLLADPELSIQSILVTRKYLGDKANTVYVVLVVLFTVLAGLLFGLLVTGEPIGLW